MWFRLICCGIIADRDTGCFWTTVAVGGWGCGWAWIYFKTFQNSKAQAESDPTDNRLKDFIVSFSQICSEMFTGSWNMGVQTLLSFCWGKQKVQPLSDNLYFTKCLILGKNIHGREKWNWESFSRVQLFATPWTIQSMEFSVGSCSLLQGISPTQGSHSGLPHFRESGRGRFSISDSQKDWITMLTLQEWQIPSQIMLIPSAWT